MQNPCQPSFWASCFMVSSSVYHTKKTMQRKYGKARNSREAHTHGPDLCIPTRAISLKGGYMGDSIGLFNRAILRVIKGGYWEFKV